MFYLSPSASFSDLIDWYKLHIPASRVFCLSESVPFHLTFVSSASSLAAFLPYAPSGSSYGANKKLTRIQLLRQSSVDVQCVSTPSSRGAIALYPIYVETRQSPAQRPISGAWCLSERVHSGMRSVILNQMGSSWLLIRRSRWQCDGQGFISYIGEIQVNPNIKIGGFRAGGLFIKVRHVSVL